MIKAWRELSAVEREALILSAVWEMDINKIAQLLGCSEEDATICIGSAKHRMRAAANA